MDNTRSPSWRPAGAVWLTVLLLINSACPAGGLLTGDTSLSDALSHVDRIIANATQDGNAVIAHAGSEVRIALQNIQNAYADDLSKLDAVTSKKLQELEELLTKLETGVKMDAEGLLAEAQQIVNTLPLSNQTPQLTSYGPRLIVRSRLDRDVVLEVRGNFTQAQDPELRPYLRMGDDTLSPIGVTTQQLSFRIPVERLPEAMNKGITLVSVSLKIPYNAGRVDPVRKLGDYTLLLGLLPETPGKISVHWKSTTLGKATHHEITEQWRYWGVKMGTECGPDLIKGSKLASKDDPLHLDAPTPCFVGSCSDAMAAKPVDGADYYIRPVPDPEGRQRVCYEASAGRLGRAVALSWHYEYDLEWSTLPNQQYTDQVTLPWGREDLFYDIVPNDNGSTNWRVEFESFDGEFRTFIGGDPPNPYLMVNIRNGNTLVLTTSVPPTF